MAEVITKGYLINREDYEVFDEVITFINEYGNIFTTLALGVKKILSKNARNLFYGSLSEFEFFASRDIDNKVGKLKKVHLLENNIQINHRTPLLLLNKIIFINKLKGTKTFEFVNEVVKLLQQYDEKYDDIIILKILLFTTNSLGLNLNLNCCNLCGDKNVYTFSYTKQGFICRYHFDQELDIKYGKNITILLYLINNSLYDDAFQIESNWKKITIRILIDYLKEYSGINLYNYLFSSNKID